MPVYSINKGAVKKHLQLRFLYFIIFLNTGIHLIERKIYQLGVKGGRY